MELIPIGQAADRLGLNPSALRYYDERGLVSPQARRAGRRMYGLDELRRLAFIKIAQRLGLPLQTAAAVLDAPGPQWRELDGTSVDPIRTAPVQAVEHTFSMQVSARTGVVRTSVLGNRVHLTGHAVTVLDGSLHHRPG